MGSEAKTEETSKTPKLQLFSLPPIKSPEHSGSLTPPLHTYSASVPFRWEELPGKPRPSTTLALPLPLPPNDTIIKSLELPPRLLNEAKMTKLPSPTTVLEGPYNNNPSLLQSTSFRKKRHGSFDGALSLRGSSPDRGLLGPMVLSSSSSTRRRDKGLFGSWRKISGGVHEDYFVNDSFSDGGAAAGGGGGATVKLTRICRSRRNRSFLGLSEAKSHFWATVYGALKQVIPRKSTKRKKDAL